MQQQIASLQQQETPFGIFSIRVKIGLAIGEISWGVFASIGRAQGGLLFSGAGC